MKVKGKREIKMFPGRRRFLMLVPDVGSWITPSALDYDTFEALAMMKAEKAGIRVASKKKDRKSPQASKPLQ